MWTATHQYVRCVCVFCPTDGAILQEQQKGIHCLTHGPHSTAAEDCLQHRVVAESSLHEANLSQYCFIGHEWFCCLSHCCSSWSSSCYNLQIWIFSRSVSWQLSGCWPCLLAPLSCCLWCFFLCCREETGLIISSALVKRWWTISTPESHASG